MKGRDALREMLGAGRPTEPVPDGVATRPSGAVKAMSLGLQRLSDEAAAARTLRATLAAGEQVVELDPKDIDSSFMSDRISGEADPEFSRLKESIEKHGQQVPILVRRHPGNASRFQAAYGHRRLRAARELGRKIKSVVRALSDTELVIAQGQENSERSDLSFIERALFAKHMDARAFDRDVITAALGIDKPEASRLLSVANAIDSEIILAIGPAPKVGRPRWLALAESVGRPGATEEIKELIASERFLKASTNARFELVLAIAKGPEQSNEAPREPLVTAKGRSLGWIERSKKGVRLISNERDFWAFLEERLPGLMQEFEASDPER